ncbi:orotidine-5'-phosphate decarboxylase [Halieaceae bacterium IMCC14734]|uniref:Orotidine 5'-phosphate decarboxylase n=1 Tax=Candidatus Litorirhabdus singularis TaxID=2518993 RepID=A0ABT3TFZ5_9GAMM|nr:orotidine-5'-phosphate decarboxylase [Candidatus Litorirhabdus singularis]MCX2981174.1 orotidine-5'-phosphate decarboxylase [Candidatus Litorirhabdus singularis]
MQSPIIVALDYDNQEAALALADRLEPSLCRLKVGKELFTRFGPALVEQLQHRGFDVFLDLKYHDIPNTVASAVRAASDLGVWMVNVHAGGGRRMMEAAGEVLVGYSQPPILIAVTVLTSLSAEDLSELGYAQSAAERVSMLAALAADSGMSGVVCSAEEAGNLRAQRGGGFALVTPGIRMAGDSSDDQRRVVTPQAAIAAGSDYLVIGRSITQAADPVDRLQAILNELDSK